MSTQTHESIPSTWVDERDVPFFRLTARLFSSPFVAGAGVLLASYDVDEPSAGSLPALGADEEIAQRTTATDLTAPVNNS